MRVDIKSEMLTSARERAGLEAADLTHRFPKLAAWEEGTARPTLKQVEDFAKATHTPVGFLFLEEPPVEKIPIPDFRTIRNTPIARPSPDLLDMIYVCQQRPGVVSRLRASRTNFADLVCWIDEPRTQPGSNGVMPGSAPLMVLFTK